MTALAGAADATNAASYNTASITPSANKLVLVTVQSRRSSAQPATPTLTGNSLTWVLVSVAYDAVNGSNQKTTLFRSMGATPTAGAITIDFGGQGQTKCIHSVAEFDGVNTGGTNGSAAIVQSVTGSEASNTTGTITLAALSDSDNMAYGAHIHYVFEATTVGSGFTEIHDLPIGENTSGFQTEYKLNETSVAASWATAAPWLGIAAEISDAASTNIKKISGLAEASVKTYNGLDNASAKSFYGLT